MTHPCRYEPDLNPTYQDMATHYGTAVIPARVKKARGQSEGGVGVLDRGEVDHRRITKPYLLQHRGTQQGDKGEAGGVQRQAPAEAEGIEETPLRDDRQTRHEAPAGKTVRVCRVGKAQGEHRLPRRSRPPLLQRSLPAEEGGGRREDNLDDGGDPLQGQRGWPPTRGAMLHGRHTTRPAHMPESHKRYLEWTPSRIVRWAEKTGPSTAELVKEIMERRPHPEQGFRSCLGIMRLGRRYGEERLEAACTRALVLKAYSYKSVESILKNKLDGKELPDEDKPSFCRPREHPGQHATINKEKPC